MTTYNHTHPGSSLPFTRPGGARPVTYAGAWKDLLVVLGVAIVVVAVFIGVFAAAGTTSTTSTTAAVHHGGAHGRADILFKQKLSGPMRATESGIARKGDFGRAHWQQMVGGGIIASAATGITGEQMSGPMSLDKLRLARHGVFGRTAAGSNGSSAAA
jgi:hypothetical protein